MQTLQERIEELMAATGWSVGKIASVADVSSSAVSQWLGRGGRKSSKSIGDFEVALRLEKASGFSAMWLAKGKGLKLAQPSRANDDQLSPDVSAGSSMIAEGVSVADTGSDPSQSIPTSMPYEPRHLKSAILLIGSLLGALDTTSKEIIASVLHKVALKSNDPEEIEDLANRAVAVATIQKPMTKNKVLNKAIQGRGDPVETGPAPLEKHK